MDLTLLIPIFIIVSAALTGWFEFRYIYKNSLGENHNESDQNM